MASVVFPQRPRLRGTKVNSSRRSGNTMDFMDAIQWLNDVGGTWSVGATPTICVVIAAVGAMEVAVPAGQLRSDQVHAALLHAVDRLRTAFADREPVPRTRRFSERPLAPVFADDDA